jgi:hypothetical protein
MTDPQRPSTGYGDSRWLAAHGYQAPSDAGPLQALRGPPDEPRYVPRTNEARRRDCLPSTEELGASSLRSGRRSLAVDPTTGPPDAFRTGTGVIVLPPGRTVTTRLGLTVDANP